jgi:hypothetical protein
MAIFALVDFIRLRIQLYLTVPRTERIRKAAGPRHWADLILPTNLRQAENEAENHGCA